MGAGNVARRGTSSCQIVVRLLDVRRRKRGKQAVGGREELLDDWERTPAETAKKFLVYRPEGRKADRETWSWNEEIQGSAQRKKLKEKV